MQPGCLPGNRLQAPGSSRAEPEARSLKPRLGHRASPRNDLNEEQYDRDHQQNVDERADGVATDHSQQPQHEQDYSDGVQHRSLPPLAQRSLSWSRYWIRQRAITGPHIKRFEVEG